MAETKKQCVEAAIQSMRYGAHPHRSPHADDLEAFLRAGAFDEIATTIIKHKRNSQAISGWLNVSERMPDNRIRVIAAHKDHTIGDCFFGSAGLMIGHCGNPGYTQERMIDCWRHTKTEDAVAADQQPTQWMELPLPPAPDANKQANPEEKHGN